jgi:hypothetical protein
MPLKPTMTPQSATVAAADATFPLNSDSNLKLSKTQKQSGLIDQNKRINAQINMLIKDLSEFTFICEYLNKAKKLINLSIQNEASECHFASFNLLKSAQTTLFECVSECEFGARLDPIKKENIAEQLNAIKSLITDLNGFSSQPMQHVPPQTNTPPIKSGHDEDWILSDFNLLSNDFNNELSFISGNLFDLNFTYKLSSVLNNNCLLMKLRHKKQSITEPANYMVQMDEDKYLLKVNYFSVHVYYFSVTHIKVFVSHTKGEISAGKKSREKQFI